MKEIAALHAFLEPAIKAVGLQLWGCEKITEAGRNILRIYVDHPDENTRVSLGDCQRVSRQVSAVLNVEDPIEGPYDLEVSSPGVERSLFTIAHYQKYIGHGVLLKLHRQVYGKRKFSGQLVAVEGQKILIATETDQYEIDFSEIDKAKLIVRL